MTLTLHRYFNAMNRILYICLLQAVALLSMAQSKDSLIAIGGTVIGKQYKTQAISHVSVHDPSIVIDNTGAQKTYYVYGSHLAGGKSVNIKDWSRANWTFSFSTPYRVNAVKKVKILKGSEVVEVDFGKQVKGDIRISASVPVYVDNVKLYSHITEGNIYKLDGTPGEYLSGIRAMNNKIK